MRKKIAIMISMIILLFGMMGLPACSSLTGAAIEPTTTASTTPVPTLIEETGRLTIPEVVDKIKPAVVSINVEITTYDFFNRPTQAEGAGSGWIIAEDGYIVTNNHVVQDADSVIVTLNDGRTFQAEAVSTDALTDLAVIKIDAQGLPVISIGDSSNLEVGEGVVAIGNALGQGISATAGIVSVVNASLDTSSGQTLLGLIQTDAAINPGNSGGPLVNMAGEVIGINSIKVAEVGVEGMGYAISINEAKPIIDALIENGYIVRPWLGIGIATVDEFVAGLYNLPVDKGVLVTNVVKDSPAEQAGFEDGDIITRINDDEITNTGELVKVISTAQVGQTLEISYWRGDQEKSASVTLAESPPPQY